MTIEDFNEQYPYLISILVHGRAGSLLFDKPTWIEEARCRSEAQAKEVALSLSLRWSAVRVSKFVHDASGARFEPCLWYPDKAKCEETEARYTSELAEENARLQSESIPVSERKEAQ